MTDTQTPGGSTRDPAADLTATDAGDCCGNTTQATLTPPDRAEVTAAAGSPCCGTTAEATEAGACCGTSAKAEAVTTGASCCG